MRILFFDVETYSPVPISSGLDVYMREAEGLMLQWAINGGEVKLHDLTADPIWPAELEECLADPNTVIVAHNAEFERLFLKFVRHMELDPSRFFCTQACALAHSLPGGLALLCMVLKVTHKLEGKDHINLFCKPRPKREKLRRATSETHPKEWEEFKLYAKGDIYSMREAYHAMPKRNYVGEHRRLFNLDMLINERGFETDTDLAHAAVELLDIDKHRLDSRTQELTSDELRSTSQRDKLLTLLCRDYGVMLDGLSADEIATVLEDDRLPAPVKELLTIRVSAAMASTAKFAKLLRCVGPDNRLRGTLRFNGASRTGRWSGRIFQPHNLRRPTMKQGEIDYLTELVKLRDMDGITMLSDLREACSNIMRGLIVAPSGRKLVTSDWSGIESRVLAWLAGEQWVLDVSTAADRKEGKDLYVHTVARAYAMALDDINSYLRQQGKGMVLSLGYEGGVAAFISVAAAYGLDLDELGRKAPSMLPVEHLDGGRDAFQWALKKDKTYGLPEHVYVACDAIKRSYREANPNVTAQWRAYKDAFAMVTQYPGEKVETGRCLFQRRGNWVMIELPSGRTLMYPSPRVLPGGQLSYMGQVNKRWARIKTYGGKIAENITQAVSNDVLRSALLTCWDDGWTPVLHVHDEIVCEEAEGDDYHNLARLNTIMRTALPWSAGLPLHTEGWEGGRYHK